MAADDSTSDCELMIDESVIDVSSEDEENFKRDEKAFTSDIFHPMSITAADIQAELFQEEETNTCTICKETFRYNIGLICHIQMEHVSSESNDSAREVKKNSNSKENTKKKRKYVKKLHRTEINRIQNEQIEPEDLSKSNPNLPKDESKNVTIDKQNAKLAHTNCYCCRKKFSDQNKKLRHLEGAMKFTCMFCSLKFCWESKYKKHLFKTHKLNAAVVCRLCSQVFDDMTQLASHAKVCKNKVVIESTNMEEIKKIPIST